MKRIFFIMVFMISALLVNAQVDTTQKKVDTKQTTVKAAELPRSVTESIAKMYPGYTIKESKTKLEDNALNFHVVVTNGTATETLVYDKDGKFLSKLPKKDG